MPSRGAQEADQPELQEPLARWTRSRFRADSSATVSFGAQTVTAQDKQQQVQAVFSRVSHRYDVMNTLMSLGMHRRWKRKFVAQMRPEPQLSLLDVAAGTGDIAQLWLEAGGGSVVVSDQNTDMLAKARKRIDLAPCKDFVQADAQTLPFADSAFDRVSCAFGLRNMSHLDVALAQMARVTRLMGEVHILEFSQTPLPLWHELYGFWSTKVIPQMGQCVAGDLSAYQYLVDSIDDFPDADTIAALMQEVGLIHIHYKRYLGGIVAHHWGVRVR